MTKSSKVTIKEVAKDAGVSVGTVSRVLAKMAEVKQPLRDRVNHSIIKLNYKPNLAARALRANHVNVIGKPIVYFMLEQYICMDTHIRRAHRNTEY